MGVLIVDHDWSKSSLGPIELWPESLKTALGIVLHSPVPIFLMWGGDHICFYNDACHESLASNNARPAVGQKGEEVWPEIWEFMGPLIEEVFRTGKSVWQENKLIPFVREGKLEDIFWTFSNTPVFDENGTVTGVLVYCQETTSKVKSFHIVEESERRFRDMADQAPMLVWMVDASAKIIYANRSLLKFIQVAHYEDVAVKGGWESVTHPEDIADVYQAFINGLTNRTEYTVEARLYNKETDKYEWFLFKAAPRFLNNNEFAGFIGTAVNIAEQKSLQSRLEQIVEERTKELTDSNNQLTRSNAELEQFAFVASHDLQEPLRKIQTFSDLIKHRHAQDVNEHLRLYLNKIESSASRMADLIKDLLDYSRLSYRKEYAYQRVDLNKILANVLTDFELVINQKKINILQTALPEIQAVALQMNQLFYNLIGNAIKFSRKDVKSMVSIRETPLKDEVMARHHLRGRKDDYIQIDFEDNGIGFSLDYAEQIFTIFQRLNDKTIYAGYGIGLALCRKIVANHQGVITATGKVNEGATFTVILPKEQK
ncbi:MAG TPA: ATP-binding protein [Chryseosolibacter sp.]|nr:ATP-binding protein [Chryseosolibacter sp.]